MLQKLMLQKLMLKKLLLIFCCFGFVSSAFAVIETYDFETDAQRARYQHFIEVLRCPKCQNQNLAGSNSPIAEDLRHELARQLKEGKQDQEIIDFMVARYGDYVLYDPQFKKNTLALWLAPLVLLLIGLGTIAFIVRHHRRAAAQMTRVETDHREEPLLQFNSQSSDASLASQASNSHLLNNQGSRRIALIFFAVAFIFVGTGSCLLYLQLGAAKQLKITRVTQQFYTEVNQAAVEKRALDPTTGEELINLLLPYLQTHKDDLNLVYVLGSTYAQLSKFEEALPWYKQYLLAVPTDERVLTEYVQLLYITAHQQLTERVLFVVDRALTLNPHNLEVLSLMAMHYHQAGQFAQAADYWQRMLLVIPKDSEAYPAIQHALAEAQHKAKKAK